MSDAEQDDPLILDACCVYTLYGSERMTDLLRAIGAPVYVSEYVLDNEALFIFDGPPGDERSSKGEIDLSGVLDAGLLLTTSMHADEQSMFIRLAQQMDDGEALTIAIAHRRGWKVATDDKRAIRGCNALDDAPDVITTPDIIRRWAQLENPTDKDIASTIQAMQARASYFPGPNHSHYEWWQRYSSL